MAVLLELRQRSFPTVGILHVEAGRSVLAAMLRISKSSSTSNRRARA